MKNIHILPTDKPSILIKDIWKNTFSLIENFNTKHTDFKAQNIYITNSEEIKVGDYVNGGDWNEIEKIKHQKEVDNLKLYKDGDFTVPYRKIILTTDQDLIKDGVQAIDDEFLEWFVQNPSCEEVEVDLVSVNEFGSEITVNGYGFDKFIYKIIIPKKEPKSLIKKMKPVQEQWQRDMLKTLQESKQETLEEAGERLYPNRESFLHRFQNIERKAFTRGAKWQQERSYSENELLDILNEYRKLYGREDAYKSQLSYFIENFKKK